MSTTPATVTGTKRMRGERLFPYILLIPAVVIVVGIIFPWLRGLVQSFTNFSLLDPDKIAFVGGRNYKDLLLTASGLHKIKITILYGVYASGIELGLGVLIAVFLNRETRGVRVLRSILPMPLMIAPVIAGIMWKLMMDPSHGVMNYMLNFIGLPGSKWIFHSSSALISIALIDIWMFTPFVVLVILAGLSSIPKELYEASAIDGAGDFANFLYITLPMILPYILLAGVFRIIDSFKMFDLFYVTTRGGPGEATMNLSTWSYLTGIKELRMGRGLAGLQVLWLINYIVAFFLLRQIDRISAKK
jgi:multiple sugar transport system permease protein